MQYRGSNDRLHDGNLTDDSVIYLDHSCILVLYIYDNVLVYIIHCITSGVKVQFSSGKIKCHYLERIVKELETIYN